MVKVNGKDENVNGKTLNEFLQLANYDSRTIAVEINEEIISKSDYDKTILNDGDIVEIISFMGGG